MELIRRDTGYGLRALLHMATHPESEAFTATELADAADTTEDFMHKIMRALRDGGIVTSRRGPSGGFAFARTPGEISLLEVVTAVQGPLQVNRCVMGLGICDRSDGCPLRPTWMRVQHELEAGLGAATLASIAARAVPSETCNEDHASPQGDNDDNEASA